jgi:hypothetical protein
MQESLPGAGKRQFVSIDELRLLSESYTRSDFKVRRMLQGGVSTEAWFHCCVLNHYFLANDINPEPDSSPETPWDRSMLVELAQPCARHYEITATTLVDDWLLCMSRM